MGAMRIQTIRSRIDTRVSNPSNTNSGSIRVNSNQNLEKSGESSFKNNTPLSGNLPKREMPPKRRGIKRLTTIGGINFS